MPLTAWILQKGGTPNQHPFVTGEYFHCKVDGVDWYASKDDDPFATAVSGQLEGDTILFVAAYQGTESMGLLMYKSNGIVGNISHELSTNGKGSNANYDNDLSINRFETDSVHKGAVVLTLLNRSKMLAEGNFSFTAYHPAKHKTVNITEGTFSIYYQPH